MFLNEDLNTLYEMGYIDEDLVELYELGYITESGIMDAIVNKKNQFMGWTKHRKAMSATSDANTFKQRQKEEIEAAAKANKDGDRHARSEHNRKAETFAELAKEKEKEAENAHRKSNIYGKHVEKYYKNKVDKKTGKGSFDSESNENLNKSRKHDYNYLKNNPDPELSKSTGQKARDLADYSAQISDGVASSISKSSHVGEKLVKAGKVIGKKLPKPIKKGAKVLGGGFIASAITAGGTFTPAPGTELVAKGVTDSLAKEGAKATGQEARKLDIHSLTAKPLGNLKAGAREVGDVVTGGHGNAFKKSFKKIKTKVKGNTVIRYRRRRKSKKLNESFLEGYTQALIDLDLM